MKRPKTTKKITKLTPAQTARFQEFVDKWTAIGLNTEPADRPRAEAAIVQIYKAANLKPPEKIIWCGSPLSMYLTDTLLQEYKNSPGDSVWDSAWNTIWHDARSSVKDAIWDSAKADIWDSTGASVRASIRTSIWSGVWDNVGTNVGTNTGARTNVWSIVWANVGVPVRNSAGANIWSTIWDSIWDSTGARVWDSPGDSNWDNTEISIYSLHETGWLAFYDYFSIVCGLEKETKKLAGVIELAKSAGWVRPYENICFVSERHNKIKFDELNRVHCEDGPAISYPNGWSIYAWHGTRIPKEWIEDRENLDPQIALTWDNIEKRRAAAEIIGWDKVLKKLDTKIIDKNPDPMIGTLIETELPDSNQVDRFLVVKCPTGRTFAIPVPQTIETALEANAATYGVEPNIIQNLEVRT